MISSNLPPDDDLRTWACVDLDALQENYRTIESAVSSRVNLLPVIKADAYGHGAVEIGRRLESIGSCYFAVATIDEGRDLRENGISAPILVLTGFMPWEGLEPLSTYDLTPVIVSFEMLERVAGFARSKRIRMHVKIDTGMGRLGFALGEVDALLARLRELEQVEVEGLMSHFACSERRDDSGSGQVEEFKRVVDRFADNGLTPKFVHMANSGAIYTYPEAHFNMVRPGIMLYGSYPDASLRSRLNLRPVMKWGSRVSFVRIFAPGSALGYGRTFVTERETAVAYVPVGYADGYPRGLSNRGSVLIRGGRCNVIGRVSMEWVLADVTHIPDVGPGEEVVLLGNGGGGDTITADEIADQIGTIPYEVLCGVSRRIPRRYA